MDFNQVLARAQSGDVTAETMVGLAYANGVGIDKDYEQGFTWLQKAAHDNSPAAKSALGWMYDKGYGVPQNDRQAFQWYLAGAQGGDPNGEEATADAYADGKGVDADPVQAVAWFTKSAALGNPVALTRLGLAYQDGLGVDKNLEKAFTYFLQAAGKNFGPAQYSVALCYKNGLYVSSDPVRAYAWCTLSMRNFSDKQAQDLSSELIASLSGEQLEQGDALVDSLTKQQSGVSSSAPIATFMAAKRARISFKNVMGHVVVSAQLAGHSNLQFLVDTGASVSFLDQKTAKALSIQPGDTYTTGMGIGKELLLSAVTNPMRLNLSGMSINNVSFRLFSTAAWDRPIGMHLDGIIGIDVLRHYGIRLDYRHRTIEFVDPAALDVGQAGDPMPLFSEGSLMLVEAKVTKFNVVSNAARLILDVGSNESITLSRNFLNANPGIRFSRGTYSYSLGGGGAVSESLTRCSQVQLGNIVIKNPPVHLITQNQGMWANGWEGSIGNEILSRFDVTIDFPHKMLYLKPIARFGDLENERGLVLQMKGWILKSCIVGIVLPDSAAAGAGFTAGDVLVQIDNMSMQGVTTDVANSLLRRLGTHHVLVKRNGKILFLEL